MSVFAGKPVNKDRNGCKKSVELQILLVFQTDIFLHFPAFTGFLVMTNKRTQIG